MSNYKDSPYKFTDPIRYFKENDPYYWEIDNIPLKQLQENVLWLKDQINVIPEEGEAVDFGVSRADFNELKPYVDGTGSLVYVNPGRFSARINDAYDKTPLQKLVQLTGNGDSVSGLSTFRTQFQNDSTTTDFAALLVSRLRSGISASAMNLNGLFERITVWDSIIQNLQSPTPQTTTTWPIEDLSDSVKKFVLDSVYRNNQTLANEFIKQFRGVARTAIVDVPSGLSIDIPPFDSRDFFYQTEDGTTQYIEGATVRIDLLFVYSKPIDTTDTTINKWENNQPIKILSPQLGLIRGAGVGVRSVQNNGNTTKYQNAKDADGNTQIMAQIVDSLIPTNGFQGLNIHGSFPSPDDLMNLAPSIQEKLESTDPRLIGQSILPIAYIVVKSNAAVTTEGSPVLTPADVVDIRPFFRTTELAYNERAGICAAIPSLSLANPVVTKYNLEKSVDDFRAYADSTYMRASIFESGKVLAAGFIYGGKDFGPEKSLAPTTVDAGWDVSKHAQQGIVTGGFWRHIDVIQYNGGRPGDTYVGPDISLHAEYNVGLPLVWKKVITVTGINTSFSDYTVDAQFYNCVPKTGGGIQYGYSPQDKEFYRLDAKHTGLYVTKIPINSTNSIKFVITVIATLARTGGVINDSTLDNLFASVDSKDASLFVAQNFINLEVNPTSGKISSTLFDVIHPTVQFKVTGLGRDIYYFENSDTGNAEIQSYS